MKQLIFVVDDSKTIRNSLEHILNSGGYETITAKDGLDGIKQLEAISSEGKLPDMIITDINMAIMDGIVFIKEVKKMPRFSSIPVLVMTTESEREKKMQGKDAGAVGWLVKPFKPEQILDVVEKILTRR